MKKLIIKNINEYNYTLVDNDNNSHNLNIEFYGFAPDVGDTIYLSEKNLHEGVLYSYGHISDEYTQKDDKDIVKIIHGDDIVYMQRYYG